MEEPRPVSQEQQKYNIMSDSLEKQLISAVATGWNEVAPNVLGTTSTLSLLASREVSENGMSSALAVASTWSSGFAAPCSGGAGGVVIFLFKTDEGDEIDRMIKQPSSDGMLRPGGRSLIDAVLIAVAGAMTDSLKFEPSVYMDLAADEKRLAAIVGQSAHIGTYSLQVGEDITSQALLLYAPLGNLEETAKEATVKASAPEDVQPKEQAAQPHATRRQQPAAKAPMQPRNIERLLDVELDIIVRFGVTNVALRDVVRMGVGTMIELNRAVDEPVDL